MENMGVIDVEFWRGKRVFVTGHTGFKGTWLSLWLHKLGAHVVGYALSPNTEPSLYHLCGVDRYIDSHIGDIRDAVHLGRVLQDSRAEIVFHMAAQPLVRDSYIFPVETYAVNVMGTVNVLEAVRQTDTVRAVVNVTTDKCYENNEWVWGYRENDRLGGYDPYSSSKACSELVTSAYRNSFFSSNRYYQHQVALASARAGNVIGGGDWAKDRLIPDCVRALLSGEDLILRNPNSIRPWQHVLEPLSGYLMLAQQLFLKGPEYAEGWNFGPNDEDAKPVGWIAEEMIRLWGGRSRIVLDSENQPHEATYLKLDCSKAKARLGWQPKWDLKFVLNKIHEWSVGYDNGDDIAALTLRQINEYEEQFMKDAGAAR